MIGFTEKNKDIMMIMMMMTPHRVYTTHGLGLFLDNSRGTLVTVTPYITSLDILSHTVDIPTIQCPYVREPFFWLLCPLLYVCH